MILVDTDILIDAGRGVAETTDCLHRHELQLVLAASSVTLMELMVGCRNNTELRQLN